LLGIPEILAVLPGLSALVSTPDPRSRPMNAAEFSRDMARFMHAWADPASFPSTFSEDVIAASTSCRAASRRASDPPAPSVYGPRLEGVHPIVEFTAHCPFAAAPPVQPRSGARRPRAKHRARQPSVVPASSGPSGLPSAPRIPLEAHLLGVAPALTRRRSILAALSVVECSPFYEGFLPRPLPHDPVWTCAEAAPDPDFVRPRPPAAAAPLGRRKRSPRAGHDRPPKRSSIPSASADRPASSSVAGGQSSPGPSRPAAAPSGSVSSVPLPTSPWSRSWVGSSWQPSLRPPDGWGESGRGYER
jgi:hypothetical protein